MNTKALTTFDEIVSITLRTVFWNSSTHATMDADPVELGPDGQGFVWCDKHRESVRPSMDSILRFTWRRNLLASTS